MKTPLLDEDKNTKDKMNSTFTANAMADSQSKEVTTVGDEGKTFIKV